MARVVGRRNGALGLALFALLTLALGCEEVPPWGVRINGTVFVRHGPDVFPLADARVILRDQEVGGYGKKNVQADSFGRYDLEYKHQYGKFEICADAPGLPLTCNPQTIHLLFAGNQPPTRDVTIVAPDALHGQNYLEDGETHCSELLFVELYSQPPSTTLLTSRESNAHGQWILGELPALDGIELRIHCGATTYARAFTLDPGHRSGAIAINVDLPNYPPVIDSLGVTDGGGTYQKIAAPGQDHVLIATVSQGDSDLLRYSWSDSAGSVVSEDSATLAWKTPSASQLDIIHLTVDDGRGGVARASLEVRVGAKEDRFIGHVYDAETDLPLSGATVDVDGISTTSDANGYYGLSIASGASHLMTVSQLGYAAHIERIEGGAPGKNVRLRPATIYNVDPRQDIEVWDGTRGLAVFIPANGLEDAGGGSPPGNVDLGIYTQDDDFQHPIGSNIARDAGATEQVYEPHQSASVEISDPSGRIYNLKSGVQATIGFQAPDIPAGQLPAVYPLLRLNEASGEWEEEGEVALVGSRYEGPVSSFSAWSTGSYAANSQACVRVDVKGGVQLPQLLRVYWWDPPSLLAQHFVGEYTLQEHVNVIFRLPQGGQLLLELVAFDSQFNTLSVTAVDTGGGVSPSEPPFPWSPCQYVKLGVRPPAETGPPSNYKYLNRIVGSESSAQSYYQSIGALPAKDTFQKWLDANQFPAGAAANDVTFFNPNELGLTRRANCNKYSVGSVDQYACYVTKYGKLGEAPQDSLWDGFAGVNAGDTVAMEFSNDPSKGGARGVKFYIYEPGDFPSDQAIKTKTAFDTDGENKYAPDVCMHCHGTYSPQFVVFDALQYEYLGVGQSHLPNVQEQLRIWNSYVDEIAQATGPSSLPGGGPHPARRLIQEIYGSTAAVYTPGSLAGLGLSGDMVFDEIAKPYCRTCHMYGPWQFDYPVPFQGGGGPWSGHICSGEMPNAMGPQLALWSSSNPFLPSIIFGLSCAIFNNPPVPTIYAPSPGTNVGFGGLNLGTYQASSDDVEDGPGCCLFEWSSDEGIMGYGHTIQYTFAAAGSHDVCVLITDSGGNTGEDCIEVDSFNASPTAVINVPTTNQILYEGQPYVFFGQGFDVNEPYLELPCPPNRPLNDPGLYWQFSVPSPSASPPNPTECNPLFVFTGTGQQTVQLTAMDPQGFQGHAFVNFSVQALPPGSPPGVAITNPDEGNLYPPDETLDLIATVTSNGGGAISLDWTADYGAGPVTISTSNPDTWIPSDDVPFNCGGQNVDVRLDATDSNGTGFHEVTIKIEYPPC